MGPENFSDRRIWSESQSEVQTESNWCRLGTECWPIEADWQHGLSEVSLEEAVLDRPTVIHKGRESPLRSIDVERCSYPDTEVVSSPRLVAFILNGVP